MIKDRVKYSKTTRGLGVQCFYCKSFDHSYTTCPNVTPIPNKELCLARHNYSQVETERHFQHRIREKINSIAKRNFIMRSIESY